MSLGERLARVGQLLVGRRGFTCHGASSLAIRRIPPAVPLPKQYPPPAQPARRCTRSAIHSLRNRGQSATGLLDGGGGGHRLNDVTSGLQRDCRGVFLCGGRSSDVRQAARDACDAGSAWHPGRGLPLL